VFKKSILSATVSNKPEMGPQTKKEKEKGTTNLKQNNDRNKWDHKPNKIGSTTQKIYQIHHLGNFNKTQILPMTKHMVP
jgi:hypothetical protein